MTTSHQVVIVAWQALPAVFPELGRRIGGIETAAWTFARGLAKTTSWTPTLVFRSESELPQRVVEGVNLSARIERWESLRRDVSECVQLSPFRLNRFRLRLLWQIPLLLGTRPFRKRDPELMQPDPRLTELSADVWIAMGVGKESAGVIATAHQKRQPCVLMIRSGADLDERYQDEALSYSAYGERSDVCRFSLQQADQIICQTETQLSKLKRVFGRDGVVVRNPIDLGDWEQSGTPSRRQGVVWVGRYEEFAKRISLALEIARGCPTIDFTLIANRDDPEVEARVRGDCPVNVTLVDYVPRDQMPARFASAQAFLSTSDHLAEGFPNVLLQAAASRTPIISLDDFDEFLSRSGAGFACDGDTEAAAKVISEIIEGKLVVNHDAVLQYLHDHHSTTAVVESLTEVLDDVSHQPVE